MKRTVITLALLAVSALAHAGEGISADEYQRMRATAQCAFIANILPSSQATVAKADKAFKVAIATFKKDNAAMLGFAYNPSPEELATDFAIHYQQSASDTEGEMMKEIHQQRLPPAPSSWASIASQFWTSRNCSIVIGD